MIPIKSVQNMENASNQRKIEKNTYMNKKKCGKIAQQ